MKSSILYSAAALIAACAISISVQAQLKVESNGYVGIGIGTSVPLSNLVVNTVGDSTAAMSVERNSETDISAFLMSMIQGNTPYVSSSNYGIKVSTNRFNAQTNAAISAQSTLAFDKCIGVKANAGYGTALPSNFSGYFQPKAYGVYATAGNLTSGYNYGIYGLLTGSNNGTGVFGGVTDMSSAIPGKYAGYFYGQTNVSGNFYATTVTETSDERLKTNIAPIEEDALSVIGKLNPVQFNWQQLELNGELCDSTKEKPKYFSPDINFEQLHYGFLAQEVRELLPNIVNEDGNGILGINYTELIPLLVIAVQDLKQQVKNLQGENKSIKRQTLKDDLYAQTVLYQNNPNPFDISTEIRYYLPADVQDASIYIYDMNGTQIKEYGITNSGDGSVTIQGSELKAGMYLYSLIADGQVIDTKRMILTK